MSDENFMVGYGLMEDGDFVGAQKYFRVVVDGRAGEFTAHDLECRAGETTAHQCLFRCSVKQGDLTDVEAVSREAIKIELNRPKDWGI